MVTIRKRLGDLVAGPAPWTIRKRLGPPHLLAGARVRLFGKEVEDGSG